MSRPVDRPPGAFIVENEYDFRSLDFVAGAWELTCDGVVIQEGKLAEADPGPQADAEDRDSVHQARLEGRLANTG